MKAKLFATIFCMMITLLALSLSIGSTPTTANSADNFNNVRVDPEGAAVGQEDPTIVAHPTQADTLYVAWEDKGDSDIYFSRSTDGGRTWGADIRIADDSESSRYDPTLAIAADGTLYLAWQDNRTPWGIYFAKSTDGGMTWSANQKVDNDSTDSSGQEPALTVGNDGTLYLAWHKDNSIYVAHSTDEGQNWSTPQTVNDDAESWKSDITIASGPADTVYLAWIDDRNEEYEIYFAYSTNNGQTFSANQKISDTDPSYRYSVNLVADENGAVYIAWKNIRNDDYETAIYLARSSNSGQSWVPNQEVHTSDDQNGLSLALKADGTVVMVWNNLGESSLKNGIYVATSSDAGQTWEISDGPGFWLDDERNDSLVLTVGANGKFYMAYDDDNSESAYNQNIYTRSSAGGQIWSSVQYQVNDESGKGSQTGPTVALDPAGGIYVMWRHSTIGESNSYFARSTDNGETWSTANLINEGRGNAFAFDSNGTLYVAWLETSSENQGLYLASSTDGGATFGNEVLISDQVETISYYPTLIVGADNTLYVLWTEMNAENVYLTYSTDGGQSFSIVKVNDEESDVAGSASIAMDSSGALYVAWTDQRDQNPDIYFSRSTDGGLNWSADVKVNDDTGSASQGSPTLAADSNGTLYLVWGDLRNNTVFGELYFSRSLDGGQNWSSNVNLVDTIDFNYIRFYESLVVTPSGTLYLMVSADIQGEAHSVYITRSTNGGESWEKPLGINEEDLNISGLSMAIGADETLALTWSDELYGANNVFFAGGQFQEDQNPTSTHRLYLPSVMR